MQNTESMTLVRLIQKVSPVGTKESVVTKRRRLTVLLYTGYDVIMH